MTCFVEQWGGTSVMLLVIVGTTCYVSMKFIYFKGNNIHCSPIKWVYFSYYLSNARNNGCCSPYPSTIQGNNGICTLSDEGLLLYGNNGDVPLNDQGKPAHKRLEREAGETVLNTKKENQILGSLVASIIKYTLFPAKNQVLTRWCRAFW